MRVRVVPYKRGSRSARAVADGLNGKLIKLENSRFRVRPSDIIINWGNSGHPLIHEANCLLFNSGRSVALSSHKLRTLECFNDRNVPHPEFTTNAREAADWGVPVIGRSRFQGSGGEDAIYLETVEENDPHVLFLKYIKKKYEYRIHVINSEIIDIQQKRKMYNVEDADFKIRNHSRGWVFARNDIIYPADQVFDIAIQAIDSLGLFFGAVDIIWNEHHQQAYALEVNTAPGLENTTLDNYISKFREILA